MPKPPPSLLLLPALLVGVAVGGVLCARSTAKKRGGALIYHGSWTTVRGGCIVEHRVVERAGDRR